MLNDISDVRAQSSYQNSPSPPMVVFHPFTKEQYSQHNNIHFILVLWFLTHLRKFLCILTKSIMLVFKVWACMGSVGFLKGICQQINIKTNKCGKKNYNCKTLTGNIIKSIF